MRQNDVIVIGGGLAGLFAAITAARRNRKVLLVTKGVGAIAIGGGSIDMLGYDAQGVPVRSPAAGIVAFAGSVAGRAVVTVDHGGGLVTTLEPVTAQVAIGDAVDAGGSVGRVDAGGHATIGTIHFGVRRDGQYINPMLLLGAVPRAVLLPCCDG